MHSCNEAKSINESGVAVPQPDGTYRWEGKPCIRFSGSWVDNIFLDDRGVIWFGSSEGLVRLDPTVPKRYDHAFNTIIRGIRTIDGRVIFGGTRSSSTTEPQIPFVDNRLRIEYAAPSYDMEIANRFQTLLEGFERGWSEWSAESFKEYSNLSEGHYRFRIRARNVYGTLGREDLFTFRILPPWYRAWWAFVLWVLFGGFFLLGAFRYYTAKLRRQNEHLEALVAKRTQELRDASLTDPLTGMRNRRFITEILTQDVKAFAEHKKYIVNGGNHRSGFTIHTVIGLFLVDIDFFKKINDSYGHEAGDHVLKQFSMALKSSVRQDDIILRIGGEEFLVVLKNTLHSYLPIYAEKVRKQIETLNFDIGDGRIVHRTCSIGYVGFPIYNQKTNALTFEQSIMIADLGMYHAKNTGRNHAVGLVAGSNIPAEDDVARKVSTSLDFAIHHEYLRFFGEETSSRLPSKE